MQDLAKQALASLPQVAPEVAKEVLQDDDEHNYHMPDTSQMLPYKPQVNVRKYLPTHDVVELGSCWPFYIIKLFPTVCDNIESESFTLFVFSRVSNNGIFVASLRQFLNTSFSAYGAHPIKGGIFPPPPVASLLLSKIPPPESFHVSA